MISAMCARLALAPAMHRRKCSTITSHSGHCLWTPAGIPPNVSNSMAPHSATQNSMCLPHTQALCARLASAWCVLACPAATARHKRAADPIPLACCLTQVSPEPVINPQLIAASTDALALLDIAPAEVADPSFRRGWAVLGAGREGAAAHRNSLSGRPRAPCGAMRCTCTGCCGPPCGCRCSGPTLQRSLPATGCCRAGSPLRTATAGTRWALTLYVPYISRIFYR